MGSPALSGSEDMAWQVESRVLCLPDHIYDVMLISGCAEVKCPRIVAILVKENTQRH